MRDNNDDSDLGREIERPRLIRDEHHKVFEARGTAYAIFGGIVAARIFRCLVLKGLGVKW